MSADPVRKEEGADPTLDAIQLAFSRGLPIYTSDFGIAIEVLARLQTRDTAVRARIADPVFIPNEDRDKIEVRCPTTNKLLCKIGQGGIYVHCKDKSCRAEHCIPWQKANTYLAALAQDLAEPA